MKPRIQEFAGVLLFLAMTTGLLASFRSVHYLLFHTMAELVAIAVSFSIFALTWASVKHLKNAYLTVLGAAYGTIGVIDVFHALTFKGMNLFPAVSTNHPAQFWLTARFIEAMALVAAPLLIRRAVSFGHASLAFAALGAAGLGAAWAGILPVTFVDGVGLTPFKIGSEYAIVAVLLLGLALLWRARGEFAPAVFRLVAGSLLLAVATEICFLRYARFDDYINELGHFLRFFSAVLAYLAIVVTGVRRPAEILFRQVVEKGSDLTLANASLAETRMQLSKAQAVAHIGSWHLDIPSNELTCSDELYRIAGLPAGQPTTLGALAAFIHPGDRRRVRAEWSKVRGGTPLDIEHRIVVGNRTLWVHQRAAAQYVQNGDLRGLTGIVQDITERKCAEETLHRREQEFRALAENSPDVIVRYDRSGRVIYVNATCAALHGWPKEAFIGKQADDMAPEQPERVRAIAATLRRVVASGSAEDLSVAFACANGGERVFHIRAVPEFDDGNEVVSVLTVARDITALKETERRLVESRVRLRELTARREEEREAERRRIARDLHEDLGQLLTTLRMSVATLPLLYGEPLRNKSKDMLALLDQAIHGTRAAVSSLRPTTLDAGLGAGLEWLAQQFFSDTGIECRLALPEGGIDLADDRATAVFRVVEEALANAARHAYASRIDIRLDRTDDGWQLMVRDNGCGFDAQARRRPTFGILGMEERALNLGGRIAIVSAPGYGTVVDLRLPAHADIRS